MPIRQRILFNALSLFFLIIVIPVSQINAQDWNKPWSPSEIEEVLKGYTLPTANWMRAHPEFFTDVKFRKKVTDAHERVIAKGIKTESDEYFRAIEKIVGVEHRNAPAQPSGDPYADGLAAAKRGDYSTAIRLWRPLAEQGHARAQLGLGLCYATGNGMAKDVAEAVRWFQRSAEQGYADAQYFLGLAYHDGKGVPRDYAEAARWYRKAADQGDAQAQLTLGFAYADGQGVSQDYAEAARWYRKAADQGDAQAQLTLGVAYSTGKGAPQDSVEAMRWIRMAADQGNATAQYGLGLAYANGEGVTKNMDESVRWVRKAADQGIADAQVELGHVYARGKEVTQDLTEATRWYRKAADQGSANGQQNLGWAYLWGKGVVQDSDEAMRWFLKAAAQNHAGAQFWLGNMYEKGRGVAQNYDEALRWYRMSADLGNSWAQNNLGQMYYHGNGVAQDYTEAMKWFQKAADQGSPNAQVSIGWMYQKGLGVEVNYAEALRWNRMGADQGDPNGASNLAELYLNGQGAPPDPISAFEWGWLAAEKLPPGKSKDNAIAFRDTAAKQLTEAQLRLGKQWIHDWKPILNKRQSPTGDADQISINAPISISVGSSLQTFDELVQITGRIQGTGKIVSLKVDGSEAPFRSDGSFSFPRAVSVGSTEIRLKATNEWGQTGETIIHVTRVLEKSANIGFAMLDPSHLRSVQRPKAIALIIGIDQYDSVPPAEFSEDDAKVFFDYAANALGVPKDRIKLLTGSDARRLDIRKALLTWVKPLIIRGQTDVFVFFSGHGLASDDGKDLFLLPYDGDRTLLADSAIRRKELIDTVIDSGAASLTMFLDTCYSGGTRGKETLVASARPILITGKDEDVPPGVTILAAARNDQLSNSLSQVKHGLFSYFLMKGLEGGAAGGDHTISAAKLEDYLADHIPPEAAKLGRTQTPQLLGDGGRVISSW